MERSGPSRGPNLVPVGAGDIAGVPQPVAGCDEPGQLSRCGDGKEGVAAPTTGGGPIGDAAAERSLPLRDPASEADSLFPDDWTSAELIFGFNRAALTQPEDRELIIRASTPVGSRDYVVVIRGWPASPRSGRGP